MEGDKDIVLYYSLNQDQDWLAVGTKMGYRIYNLTNVKLVAQYDNASVGIIEMLYSTNLLAIVGADNDNNVFSPKRLTIWNSNNSNSIWEISFPYRVTAVKINKQRLVICIKDKIHIYDLKDTRILESLVVKNNQLGRLVLSPNNSENCYLVYTDSITKGTVKVYDAWNLRQAATFDAHQSPILKMSMNFLGSKLVTTSCKGTIIRVFSLPKGQKLYTFKRGMANTMIYSLNFSRQGNYIVLSSENGTVHWFQLPNKEAEVEEDNSGNEEEDENFSDLSVAKDEAKECSVFNVASWIQTCLPIDYKELMVSKKSDYRLTSEEFNGPNICCMDRGENNIIMFMKKGEFKMINLEGGKLEQDHDFDAQF